MGVAGMSKRFRFFILAVLVALGASFIYPTIHWYFIVDKDTKALASSSKEQIRKYAKDKAQAGMTTLLALAASSPDSAVPAEYGFLLQTAKKNYEDRVLEQPATWNLDAVVRGFKGTLEQGVPVSYELRKALEDQYAAEILAYKRETTKIIQLGLDLSGGISAVLQADASRAEALSQEQKKRALNDDERKEALERAVETLKARADSFGVSEPIIRSDFDNLRVYLDIPGLKDPERISQFLVSGGSLRLQIVDDETTEKFLAFQNQFKAQNGGAAWEEGFALPQDLIPAGMKIRAYVQKDTYGVDVVQRYIVTKETGESLIDGSYISEAQPDRDQFGKPTVNFVMTGEGAEKFRTMTRDNVGKSMAIVLDGKVRAYANIQEEIGAGQVRITGFSFDESQAIAKVLRAGALSVDLTIDSVQSVGAALGEDAIKSGMYAVALGFALVIVFMLVYYLGSGVVANIALLMNVFFMMAILSVFNLTLSLTSIAGLILTVGMAVDANVIIFERIKEENLLGKSRSAAVKTGYGKAFWTILDSNITTIIASVLLASFGTGPIKGFAVTLTVGIITSMFTALFVTRLIQDFGTEQLGQTKLSIAWGRK